VDLLCFVSNREVACVTLLRRSVAIKFEFDGHNTVRIVAKYELFKTVTVVILWHIGFVVYRVFLDRKENKVISGRRVLMELTVNLVQ